jgi:hypothetical protein
LENVSFYLKNWLAYEILQLREDIHSKSQFIYLLW